MGYVGNEGTLDTDYLTSIDNRMVTNGSGAFRFGAGGKTDYADFDQSVDPINSYSQCSGGGGYLDLVAAQLRIAIAAGRWNLRVK